MMQKIFFFGLIGVLVTSCVGDGELSKIKCQYKYHNVTCVDKICLSKKICDEGALGELFEDYSLKVNDKIVDLEIGNPEFIDTIIFKGDSLKFYYDDFQFAMKSQYNKKTVKISSRIIFVEQIPLSAISKELIILDSIEMNNGFVCYKYSYFNEINRKENIQYSLLSKGDLNLPIKGNLIQAANGFYYTFMKAIYPEKNKIIIEYDKRGKDLIFFIDSLNVSLKEN